MPIGTLPNLTTAEASTSFAFKSAFPHADTEIRVTAVIDGVPQDPSNDLVYTLTYQASQERRETRPIPTVQTDRRFVGTAMMDQASNFPSRPHTNARMTVYLPYYNGVSVVADGGFNPALHIPVIDGDDLRSQLILRNLSDVTMLNYEMPSGTPVHSDGTISWPAAGEPNAHRLIIFDPATNTLTGNIGVVYPSEALASNGFAGFNNWRLRWDADFNDAAIPFLPSGTQFPTQYCLQSNETGPVAAGNGAWCSSRTSTIGDESVLVDLIHTGCPAASSNTLYRCNNEASPYPPGSDGLTAVRLRNNTSRSGDAVVQLQVPGRQGSGRTADLTQILVGPGFRTPNLPFTALEQASDGARLLVTTEPADYTGSPDNDDITSRTFRAADDPSWVECPIISPRGPRECDVSALATAGIDIADVTEIRFEVDQMRPQFISTDDQAGSTRQSEWNVHLRWTVRDDVAPSIDGAPYSGTSTASTAWGSASAFSITHNDGALTTATDTDTAEVTRQSFTVPCGVGPGGSVAALGLGSCANNQNSQSSRAVLSVVDFNIGLENSGSLGNVFGPFEMCAPIPTGIRLENSVTADRNRPVVVVGARMIGGSTEAIPQSAYSSTYTPAPPGSTYAGDLCINVPTLNGITPNGALEAGFSLQALVKGLIVPGVSPIAMFVGDNVRRGTVTSQGQSASGEVIEVSQQLNRGLYRVSGRRQLSVTESVDPSERIGLETEVCYDYEIDSHAFTETGFALDPNGSTLPTENTVSYQWIPNTNNAQPAAMTGTNTANSEFSEASSEDALAVWVHTANDPNRGNSTTLQLNGFQQCAVNAPCDATALLLLGLTPQQVRWVAFEFDTINVTDAEPRGVAPFDGETRVNNPYQSRVCLDEDGTSASETNLATILEIQSDLLSITSEPVVVVIDTDCPNGAFAAPESCDSLDNDCDGSVDEGFITGEECEAGLGACLTTGFTVCSPDGSRAICDAVALPSSDELCDGIDNDCDGDVDDGFDLGQVCSDGVGECISNGQTVCSTDGLDIACDALIIPGSDELCDGLDNDCDGTSDDGFGLGDTCTVGIGACQTDGELVCLADGSGSECDGVEGAPSTETCDGTDGDCDGVVDSVIVPDVGPVNVCADTDEDGLTDLEEYTETNTDPFDDDTDDDGLIDFTEVNGPTDPLNPDTDDDGVQDGTELGLTEPEGADTNEDVFMVDADPTSQTDPLDDDSDDDGLVDGSEDADSNGAVDTGETDPDNADSDDDLLQDGTESGLTEPEGDDTNTDGLSDLDETTIHGTDPDDDDTDNDTDGVQDGTESGLTAAEGDDTDDGLFVADEDETTTTDPLNDDSDGDRLLDGDEDANGDGAVDDDETDPNDMDTDDGSVADGDEVDRGSDPLDASDDVPVEPDTGAPDTGLDAVVGGGCNCDSGKTGAGWLLALPLLLGLRRRRSAAVRC